MPIQLCKVPDCYAFGKYCRIEGHTTETFKASPSIKQAADSKKDINSIYKKLAKQFITTRPKCEVKGCRKVSECVHHKRGRTGDLLTDKRYFMAVCQDHHRQIEDDPQWAKQEGYSESRLKKNHSKIK